MRFGITTEQLTSTAATLRRDADDVGTRSEPLAGTPDVVGTWACGRAQRAAQAFIDALGHAAEHATSGLRELGERAGAGAEGYEAVEHRLQPGP